MVQRGEGLSGLVDESAELLYALPAVVWVEGCRDPGFEPPVPGASRCNEPRCGVGAKHPVEVQERPEDGWLVVVEVGTRQVVIKVGAEQFGIRCSAELRKGDAVRPARVRSPAGEQEPTDEVAELGPVGHGYQPAGSLALAPAALEEDAKLGGSDLVGSLTQIPYERRALDRAQPVKAPAQPKVSTIRRNEPPNQLLQLG